MIVGNEVLLRGELPADRSRPSFARCAAIKQYVSYADLEYWLRHPQLAQEVNFITVHFLPYWEDDDQSSRARWHILAIYRKVKQATTFGRSGRRGRAGRAGRDREPPGRVMQAKFLSAFARLAKDNGLDYNIVELGETVKPSSKARSAATGHRRRAPCKFGASGWVTEHPR